jgi:protein TonB
LNSRAFLTSAGIHVLVILLILANGLFHPREAGHTIGSLEMVLAGGARSSSSALENAVKSPIKNPVKSKSLVSRTVTHESSNQAHSNSVSSARDTENRAGTAAQSSITDVGSGDSKNSTFLSELRQAIEAGREYPSLAKARHQTGRVEVGFTLTKAGEITNARILKKCGFETLNEAALDAVCKIHKFKAVPDNVSKTDFDLIIPIEFRLD